MTMKLLLSLSAALVLASCANRVGYKLTPEMQGLKTSVTGTVLSVEEDGDFLLESDGLLVFVDADDLKTEVEMGERVTVSGEVDYDPEDTDAPELDAIGVAAAR